MDNITYLVECSGVKVRPGTSWDYRQSFVVQSEDGGRYCTAVVVHQVEIFGARKEGAGDTTKPKGV